MKTVIQKALKEAEDGPCEVIQEEEQEYEEKSLSDTTKKRQKLFCDSDREGNLDLETETETDIRESIYSSADLNLLGEDKAKRIRKKECDLASIDFDDKGSRKKDKNSPQGFLKASLSKSVSQSNPELQREKKAVENNLEKDKEEDKNTSRRLKTEENQTSRQLSSQSELDIITESYLLQDKSSTQEDTDLNANVDGIQTISCNSQNLSPTVFFSEQTFRNSGQSQSNRKAESANPENSLVKEKKATSFITSKSSDSRAKTLFNGISDEFVQSCQKKHLQSKLVKKQRLMKSCQVSKNIRKNLKPSNSSSSKTEENSSEMSRNEQSSQEPRLLKFTISQETLNDMSIQNQANYSFRSTEAKSSLVTESISESHFSPNELFKSSNSKNLVIISFPQNNQQPNVFNQKEAAFDEPDKYLHVDMNDPSKAHFVEKPELNYLSHQQPQSSKNDANRRRSLTLASKHSLSNSKPRASVLNAKQLNVEQQIKNSNLTSSEKQQIKKIFISMSNNEKPHKSFRKLKKQIINLHEEKGKKEWETPLKLSTFGSKPRKSLSNEKTNKAFNRIYSQSKMKVKRVPSRKSTQGKGLQRRQKRSRKFQFSNDRRVHRRSNTETQSIRFSESRNLGAPIINRSEVVHSENTSQSKEKQVNIQEFIKQLKTKRLQSKGKYEVLQGQANYACVPGKEIRNAHKKENLSRRKVKMKNESRDKGSRVMERMHYKSDVVPFYEIKNVNQMHQSKKQFGGSLTKMFTQKQFRSIKKSVLVKKSIELNFKKHSLSNVQGKHGLRRHDFGV